jgi:hypothetical protein
MHARAHVNIQLALAIPGAKDDVKDNFAERLRHLLRMMMEMAPEVNRAFSADECL